MNPDEFEDRYRALETLTVHLIRHMRAYGLLDGGQVADLMSSLTDLADDDRATWCAERLVRRVNGPKPMTGTEAWDMEQALAEQRARAYGTMPVPVDL
jgi:hypothetical protein